MAQAILEDDVIMFRALEPTDLDILYEWENNPELWSVGSSIAPFSRKLLWDYIESYTPDIFASGQLRLMIVLKQTGETIGTLDFYEFDFSNRRSGVGLLIDPRYSGKGYGKKAIALATEYATKFIGMHQLWAQIPIDNSPSLSVFKSCGYKICGRLRSWLRRGRSFTDVYMLQKLTN